MTVVGLRGGGADGARNVEKFAKLVSIKITSDYFNMPEISSGEFGVKPTANTESLIRRLGLTRRNSANGIALGFAESRKGALLAHVKGRADDFETWSSSNMPQWLSFTVTPTDPAFFQYADLPIDFNPRQNCLYLYSRNLDDAVPALTPGSKSDGGASHPDGPRTLRLLPRQFDHGGNILPKLGPTIVRAFPDGCDEIELLNVLSEQVQCYPRKIPAGLLDSQPIEQIDCAMVQRYLSKHPNDEMVERAECTIQLQGEGAGGYSIRFVDVSRADEEFVYPGADATCVAFIDIFLTDPDEESGQPFPVTKLFAASGAEIAPLAYVADFAARSVFWNYIVVPQDGEKLIEPEFYDQDGNSVPFEDPVAVVAPGGKAAVSLRSMSPYPLQEKPAFRIEMRGVVQKANGLKTRKGVLASALPTPDPTQLSALAKAADKPISHQQEGGGQTDQNTQNIGVANIYFYL